MNVLSRKCLRNTLRFNHQIDIFSPFSTTTVPSAFQLNKIPFYSTIEALKPSLKPPVANKLLFSKGIKVMVVGGPNQRSDFHIEMGEELFYQIKGDMDLIIWHPIHQQKETIRIKEGEYFLLPGGIFHSPQRYENTLGLVFERERNTQERDGLRWFKDINTSQTVEYEEYFHCKDLGSELVPIIERYQQLKTNPQDLQQKQQEQWTINQKDPLITQLLQAQTSLESIAKPRLLSQALPTFGTHKLACSEFEFEIIKGVGTFNVTIPSSIREVFVWQYSGSSVIGSNNETTINQLNEGDAGIVTPLLSESTNVPITLTSSKDIVLCVYNNAKI